MSSNEDRRLRREAIRKTLRHNAVRRAGGSEGKLQGRASDRNLCFGPHCRLKSEMPARLRSAISGHQTGGKEVRHFGERGASHLSLVATRVLGAIYLSRPR
jgi:hypothetical protein